MFRKAFNVIAVFSLGAVSMYFLMNYVLILRHPLRTVGPEEVVIRSFQLLREGRLAEFRKCHTESAQAFLKGILFRASEETIAKGLPDAIREVTQVKISQVTVKGEAAEVVVAIVIGASTESETFCLLKSAKGWRID